MSDKKKDEQVYNATENFDKVGSFENKSYNGGSGVGSKSNVEKLAQDYVNSNYDSFTKGTDYASLAKRYSGQGRQAMDDTIGQMAARTGGLASSWAASAGQQAYGGWMEKLEDAARSLYNDQMNEKMSKLGVAQGLYDRDYGEFVDNRNFNYGMYKDNVENAKWKDTMGYQQNRDNVADEQWNKTFEYQQNRDSVADEQWNKTFEYQQNQDTKEAAEDFKDSIYDAAYWGNVSWGDFEDNEYGITKAEFDRIVKSAEGARGDDTYERNLADKETEEDNLYAEIYYGGSYESWDAYKEAGGTLDKRSYERIVKQAQTDSAPTVDNFVKANYLRQTESGNYVFEKGGKEIELEAGINPYTYTRNPDTKHGAFTNGYQPNNVNGNTLSEADYDGELYVNGVKQKVWETSDGQWYYWDGTQNKYIETSKKELEEMANGE